MNYLDTLEAIDYSIMFSDVPTIETIILSYNINLILYIIFNIILLYRTLYY